MAGYEKKVKALLKTAGGIVERNPRGSHVIWTVSVGGKQVEVSVPAKIKSRHTANDVLKEAGIDEKI